MAENENHGGHRKGAGRPRQGNVMLRARVQPYVLEALKKRATQANLLLGDYLAKLIED